MWQDWLRISCLGRGKMRITECDMEREMREKVLNGRGHTKKWRVSFGINLTCEDQNGIG